MIYFIIGLQIVTIFHCFSGISVFPFGLQVVDLTTHVESVVVEIQAARQAFMEHGA